MNVSLSYHDYLSAAAARYESLSTPEHPGWGPVVGADVTIGATAEVLSVLAAAGRSAASPAVRQGVRAIIDLWAAEEAKGPTAVRWTRQATFAVLGLAAFPALAREPAVAACLEQCGAALGEGFVRGAGWHDARPRRAPDGRQVPPRAVTSIHQTALTVVAAAQLGDRKLAAAGRDVLLEMRGNDGTAHWWPIAVDAPQRRGSHAMTALAALALLDGHDEHVAAGKDACRWLMSNHAKWRQATEDDPNVDGAAEWLHLTFSLGVRACLRAGLAPQTTAFRASFDYMNRLWPATGDEWQEHPRGRRTVRASAAVVLAHEELRAAWARADPYDVLRSSTTQPRHEMPERIDATLELGDDLSVLIRGSAISEPTRVFLTAAGWDVLATCCEVLGPLGAASQETLEHAYKLVRERNSAHRRGGQESTGFSRALRRLEQTIRDRTDDQIPRVLDRHRGTFRLAVSAIRVPAGDTLAPR